MTWTGWRRARRTRQRSARRSACAGRHPPGRPSTAQRRQRRPCAGTEPRVGLPSWLGAGGASQAGRARRDRHRVVQGHPGAHVTAFPMVPQRIQERTGRTRCGAMRSSSRPHSEKASRTRPKSGISRYRKPPWMSLLDRLEVPLAQSRASTTAVVSPRVTASSAQPAPTTPPPMTRMSTSPAAIRATASCCAAGTGASGTDHDHPADDQQVLAWDLSPGRSIVEWFTAQGMQVFTLSWKNPTAEQAHFNLDTYAGACIEAGRVVEEITGADSLHVTAACSGGQIAAATVGHLVATGRLGNVASLGLFVCALDRPQEGVIGALTTREAAAASVAASAVRGTWTGARWLRSSPGCARTT